MKARSGSGTGRALSRRQRLQAGLLAGAAALGLAMPVHADDLPAIRNNYGGSGLIDMPSARLAPDGELGMGATYFGNIQRYMLTFQALPWLETSFRYSGLAHHDRNFPVYWDRSFSFKARLWDEGNFIPAVAIGVNDLVGTGIYTGEYVVASKQFGSVDATLGMGWGRLATEPAFRNPLGLVFPSFKSRAYETSGVGQFSLKSYFRGRNVGLFGGLQWATPLDGLSLLAEYSSDAYAEESASGAFHPKNQMNFGASYAISDQVSAGLNWMYGRSIGGNLMIRIDPVHALYEARMGTPPPEMRIRNAAEQQQALLNLIQRQAQGNRIARQTFSQDRTMLVDGLWQAGFNDVTILGRTLAVTARKQPSPGQCATLARMVASYGSDITAVTLAMPGQRPVRCAVPQLVQAVQIAANTELLNLAALPADLGTIDASAPVISVASAERLIRADANKQGLTVAALSLQGGEAVVYYQNGRYFPEIEAVERLTRVLMADAPPDIEKFRLIGLSGGMPQRQFVILRSVQERTFAQQGHFDLLGDAVDTTPAPMANPVLALGERHAFPRFNWDVSPQLRQQLFDPNNPLGLQLVGLLGASVELHDGLSLLGGVEGTLFQTFSNRGSDSQLPHVRTDYLQYTRKKAGVTYAEANYTFRITPEVFANVRGGILEPMFGGVGGQLLYRPEGQRWAIGVDAYEVWQRDFDRLFGFQHYHAFTGHVSLYYASPWYNLDFAVHAGQYLAGDRGLTFEISRRFSTGVEIGVFATRTNVSAARFGEGSFDKGIILRIPMEWFAPFHTQAALNMDLRPVQRDGGQRLSGDNFLFEQTRSLSQAEILNTIESR